MALDLDRKKLDSWIARKRRDYERALKELVEIPSVSMDPSRLREMHLCAKAARGLIESMGGKARVAKTSGYPVVVGELGEDRAAPVVTIYNHLDVQPADGPDWERDPFRLAVEGDRYYARGATDDKGPALTALFAARAALDLGIPIRVRFVWELEEEIGSPHFEEFVRREKGRLETESIVVSDTIWVSRRKPAVSAGLRGLQGAVLRLETGTKDCHSGLAGGAARNPITELAEVLARCVDARTGHVLVPAFYDDVEPPTAAELRGFRQSGFSVASFKRAHGLKSLRFDDPLDVMRSVWAKPTFEVHGIAGGYQGPGVKTVVPPWAEAKVSMRLVPRQKPRKVLALLERHVRRLNPDVRVRAEGSLEPYRGVTEGPHARAVARAIEFAFGRKPAFVREGGSIGAIVTLEKHLRRPILFLGLSLPEHGYHAPNEFFDWGQASGGMRAFASYFCAVAGGLGG